MANKLLLTGAGGFIGSRCIASLCSRGYEVHTISRSGNFLQDVVVHRGDLLDLETLPRLLAGIAPTHLLHTAWDVTHGDYWTSPVNKNWVAAGEALLHAFRAGGGRRAVGVGTCAEYEWSKERYSEIDTPLRPATPYGAAKLALGRAFESANSGNFSTAWGRLFFPYGPGEKLERLIPAVITALLTGRPVECTAGTQLRDFLYVTDIGEALAALTDSAVTGAVNIGSGQGIALRDVVNKIATRIGRLDLVRLGALPIREGDPPSIVADSIRLAKEVGFVPAIGIDEGIERTIAYWRYVT